MTLGKVFSESPLVFRTRRITHRHLKGGDCVVSLVVSVYPLCLAQGPPKVERVLGVSVLNERSDL